MAGLACPKCGCNDMRNEDNTPVFRRPWDVEKVERKTNLIRRRLRCRYCGNIVYTRETIEIAPIFKKGN